MSPRLKEAYESALHEARRLTAVGDLSGAFGHLERANVLGQRSTRAHVRAHREMLRIGLRRRDLREVCGQIFRMLGAALLTRFWVPDGNTGGANVSAFEAMSIPPDLRRLLDEQTTG